ncbi:MAG: hypothetical protein JO015_12645 [Verrucomicrobia bacterium]|nr:hypothetical protein [Verrucomicrobiota bacterium]
MQNIGAALLGIQLVEHHLDVCLHLAFRDKDHLSAQEIENLGRLERHETLRNLLKQLRARTTVPTQLDLVLSKFLDERNKFVHRLFETGFHLDEDPGAACLGQFLEEMIKETRRLIELFTAVLDHKMVRSGAPLEQWPPDVKWLFDGPIRD